MSARHSVQHERAPFEARIPEPPGWLFSWFKGIRFPSSTRGILGSPDDLKLRSCATLFAQIRPENPIFRRILDTFYFTGPDQRTIKLLGLNG